jgi:hypothetical protein
LQERITLFDTPVERYRDQGSFDLVWFPSFFIPERVLDDALSAVLRCMGTGGVLVVGVSDLSEDELTGALDDLMTVRSGGTPLAPDDAVARLERAGFAAARQIPRTWKAPLRLVVASPAPATMGIEPSAVAVRGEPVTR